MMGRALAVLCILASAAVASALQWPPPPPEEAEIVKPKRWQQPEAPPQKEVYGWGEVNRHMKINKKGRNEKEMLGIKWENGVVTSQGTYGKAIDIRVGDKLHHIGQRTGGMGGTSVKGMSDKEIGEVVNKAIKARRLKGHDTLDVLFLRQKRFYVPQKEGEL